MKSTIRQARQQVKNAKFQDKYRKTKVKRKAINSKPRKLKRLQGQLIKLQVEVKDKVWGPRHLIVKLVCCRLGAAWLGAQRGQARNQF